MPSRAIRPQDGIPIGTQRAIKSARIGTLLCIVVGADCAAVHDATIRLMPSTTIEARMQWIADRARATVDAEN